MAKRDEKELKELRKQNDLLRTLVSGLLEKKAGNDPAPREKREWDPAWKKTDKTCPNCGETKRVDPDFGVRVVRDVERAQPWCRECRNKTNYHNRPRKNRSVHNP
jgi:hypothetical protein